MTAPIEGAEYKAPKVDAPKTGLKADDYLTHAATMVEGFRATPGELDNNESKNPLAVVDAILAEQAQGDLGKIQAATDKLSALDSGAKMKLATYLHKDMDTEEARMSNGRKYDKKSIVQAAAALLKIHEAVGSEHYEQNPDSLLADAKNVGLSRTIDNVDIFTNAVEGIKSLQAAGIQLNVGPRGDKYLLNALADHKVVGELLANGGDYRAAVIKYRRDAL